MKKLLLTLTLVLTLTACGNTIKVEVGQESYTVVETDSIIVQVITNDDLGFTVEVDDDSIISYQIDDVEDAILINGKSPGVTTVTVTSVANGYIQTTFDVIVSEIEE